MALRSDWSGKACPMARGIHVLGDPWVLLVLRELFAGATRFDELRDRTGAADNVLTKRLADMVEAGLIVREAYREGPRPRYDYRLTEAGADALPVLHAYALWAEKHDPPAEASGRLRVICRSCGQQSTQGESCSSCGAALTTDNAAWVRPGSTSATPRPLSGPVGS
ncbi:winged helix-turn-helix transcriptional regulator [Aeromicrobium phoceense]|uniref:winged helix-turn-helix transcriptional regulator n=2 Tax=Aeromicrobium TaxID=2040 RepID=UPI0028AD54E6|nr:helix-turn-helix domain-containing protein [Aeromicrobium phoceense]